jgi:hypothetical protein
MNVADHSALPEHVWYLEDDPEVLDPEQKEDQGEKLTNMYAPGCTALDQAHLTAEQTEELRRPLKRHREFGRVGGPDTVSG